MAGLLRCSIAQRLLPGIRQLTSSSALLQEAERVSGTCKWFNSTKGFGFITPDDGGADVFVHQTNIIVDDNAFRSLRDGEPVEFSLEQAPDGRMRAVQVTGPNGASPLGSAPRARTTFDRGYGGNDGPRDKRVQYDEDMF